MKTVSPHFDRAENVKPEMANGNVKLETENHGHEETLEFALAGLKFPVSHFRFDTLCWL